MPRRGPELVELCLYEQQRVKKLAIYAAANYDIKRLKEWTDTAYIKFVDSIGTRHKAAVLDQYKKWLILDEACTMAEELRQQMDLRAGLRI